MRIEQYSRQGNAIKNTHTGDKRHELRGGKQVLPFVQVPLHRPTRDSWVDEVWRGFIPTAEKFAWPYKECGHCPEGTEKLLKGSY